jgi:Polysaccharide lyase
MRTRASGCGRTRAEGWVFVGRRDDTPPPRRPAPGTPEQSPESPAPVLWEDSFERADIRERWAAVQEVQSDHTARTSAAHARDGARCARFEVRDGDIAESSTDERQQLSDARMPDGTSFRPKEGDDFYIAVSLWFQPGFPFVEGDAAWQVYLPFVSFDARGSGPAKLGSGGPLRFEGVEDVPWVDSEPTATGGWHDFVLHLTFSQNPQIGLLQIWHRTPSGSDYARETLANGQQTRHFATLLQPSAYLKLGIYRDGRFTRTGVLYVDRIKVANSFASVAIPRGA